MELEFVSVRTDACRPRAPAFPAGTRFSLPCYRRPGDNSSVDGAVESGHESGRKPPRETSCPICNKHPKETLFENTNNCHKPGKNCHKLPLFLSQNGPKTVSNRPATVTKCPKHRHLAHPVWYVPHMKHTTTCNTPKTRSVTLFFKNIFPKNALSKFHRVT